VDNLTPMQALVIAFVWALNLGISFWNARAVGLSWAETKAAGGWHRFMAWMGATMASVGFSWCYLIFLAMGAYHFQYIGPDQFEVSVQLGYLILIPFILFSGYAITLDSWARAFRQGGWQNYGVAAFNTASTLHNTYGAIRGFGPALSSVMDFFGKGSRRKRSSSEDRDTDSQTVVLMLVGASLAAGVITTAMIIKSYAGSRAWAAEEKGQFS
jgi:hypothetical protein